MKQTMTLILMVAAAMVGAMTSVSAAADGKAQLLARMEARVPQILAYKDAGTIGETARGYLEAVNSTSDATLAQLVNGENADRLALYRIVAAENKTSPELVGQTFADVRFRKARVGHYLKGKDGQWTRKQ